MSTAIFSPSSPSVKPPQGPDTLYASDVRLVRRNQRARQNMVRESEKYAQASLQFLRLALMLVVKPSKRSPLHHRQINGSVNPAHLHGVCRELHQPLFDGLSRHGTALRIMSLLDQVPSTTGFPTLDLDKLRRAYYCTKINSDPSRYAELIATQEYHVALRKAKQTLSKAFAAIA